MIYYPLSTLMLAGIREVLLISTPHDLPRFEDLLGDGSRLGMHISYAVQPKPEGLAQAFIIGADFVGQDRVALILGDNLFYGHGLAATLQRAASITEPGATIFGYYVRDPQRYGVVEFADNGRVIGLEEKPEQPQVRPRGHQPEQPKSSYAVPGLYFYDNSVLDIAQKLAPSPRGELEITDVNRAYLDAGKLRVEFLGRGTAWLDTGTHQSLLQASNFIEAVEQRQGLKIGCLEEVAYRMGFINRQKLQDLAGPMQRSEYGGYLMHIANESHPN
ncbi:hypothetical protein Q3G72_004977 [Acer saccharum]|nr:hypothetical protein Q3G72_004977 [Acer saccharum]